MENNNNNTNGAEASDFNNKKKISIKSFAQLAEEGKLTEELKKIFGNYVLERTTVLLTAERGLGKTFLAMEMCIAVARGDKSFCGEPIELHGNTLFINMELGETVLAKRMSKLYNGSGENEFTATAITCRYDLDTIEEELVSYIKEHKPVLIVVDNLRSAFSNKNNESNQEMTKTIMRLNDLRDQFGFALVLVHHTKKGTSDQLTSSDLQSGAGAISDMIDADFFLRRSKLDPNCRLLRRIKSRHCEEQHSAKLIQLDPGTLWFKMVEEEVDEADHILPDMNPEKEGQYLKARELKTQGYTIEQIAKELGVNRTTVWRWFKAG